MRNREYQTADLHPGCIFVPVSFNGTFGDCLVKQSDYEALLTKGISGNWFNKNGYAAVKVRENGKAKAKYVHRLIHANDNRDIEVFFKSNNKLDLRTKNVVVTAARGAKWRLGMCRRRQQRIAA